MKITLMKGGNTVNCECNVGCRKGKLYWANSRKGKNIYQSGCAK